MGILSVSRCVSSQSGVCAAENTRAAAVNVIKVSARDTAFFSEQAKKAAQTAAEKTGESPSADKSGEKSFSELIKEQTEKIDNMFSSKEYDRSSDRQLISIKLKMRGGLTLSADEERYLSQKDPDSYSNYRTVLDARKMFRCQLASCRTKDEVNGMRLSNALSALSAYKKAIKKGGDGAEVAGLNMALEREISDFARSGRYQSLPTAAERSKYYLEIAKARKFEREKQAAKRLNALRKKKKQVKQPGDGKRTVAQVENSALGQKIRKADRGGSCGVCFTSFAGSSYKKMDQKG